MGTRPYIIVREAGEVIFQNNELKDLRKDATNPPPGVLGKWTGKLKLMGEAGRPGMARCRRETRKCSGQKSQ